MTMETMNYLYWVARLHNVVDTVFRRLYSVILILVKMQLDYYMFRHPVKSRTRL